MTAGPHWHGPSAPGLAPIGAKPGAANHKTECTQRNGDRKPEGNGGQCDVPDD